VEKAGPKYVQQMILLYFTSKAFIKKRNKIWCYINKEKVVMRKSHAIRHAKSWNFHPYKQATNCIHNQQSSKWNITEMQL